MEHIVDLINIIVALGYNPIPTAVAISIIFIGRERFIRPLRNNKDLKPAEGRALHARYQARIMYASWMAAFLTVLAIKRPDNMYDAVLVVMWSTVHTFIGTQVYYHLYSRGFVESTENTEDLENGQQ